MMNENNGEQSLKGSKLYLQNCINNNPDKLSELINSASPSLTAFRGAIKVAPIFIYKLLIIILK